jgi:hypothetical protein
LPAVSELFQALIAPEQFHFEIALESELAWRRRSRRRQAFENQASPVFQKLWRLAFKLV